MAEELLARVMNWDTADVGDERLTLQALATYKYDEYQQFSPGKRFIEVLALWLEQFDTQEKRRCAYHFMKSRLIFISNAEMTHLVDIAFADYIQPYLVRQTAALTGHDKNHVVKISNSNEYQIGLRRSLFLGLSDGARIDIFRRSNPSISHEQVWPTYDLSSEKAHDLKMRLIRDLSPFYMDKVTDEQGRFRTIFLIDDFSGSGLSYLRKETSKNKFAGKIDKVMTKFYKDPDFQNLIDMQNLTVCILLYVATEQAEISLRMQFQEWLSFHNLKAHFDMLVIQRLNDDLKISPSNDAEIVELLKEYFDESIIDEHYKKGKYTVPYLGFDACALPLILNHNTPNNSLPLLWFEENRREFQGLFPRVSRHGKEA